MVRFTGKKNRVARRFGVNIFGRARNPLLHKQNPPGMHGARRRKKSDFGLQLEEKQKLKAVYGMITEKKLVNYYREADRRKGNTAHFLVQFLECRLDTVVFRLGFARTIFGAQQLVTHGHVLVNGKKVNRRSFEIKPGMVVSIREKSKKIKAIGEALENSMHVVPEYLTLDKEKFSGKLETLPEADQAPWPLEINVPTVCDFLAHTT